MKPQGKACLLLLPEPPTEISLSTFRAAYGPGLQSALSKINQWAGQDPTSLDICLFCNKITPSRDLPRSASFAYVQSLLKQMYSLLAVVLAEQTPELEDESLDIRIYILGNKDRGELNPNLYFRGPILASDIVPEAPRQWTDVFGVDSEAGGAILQAFIDRRKSISNAENVRLSDIHRVPGGVITGSRDSGPGQLPNEHELGAQRYHRSIAVGGTFDHLHLGHKLLLTATALVFDPLRSSDNQPCVLTIGITTTALLLNKAHASVLESWSVREQSVIKFLTSILDLSVASPAELKSERFEKDERNGTAIHYTFPGLLVRCVEIEDAYGPTITDEDIDALVVSAETRKGGAAVNQKRREKGWRELDVFEVDVLDANPSESSTEVEQDFKSKISSTEIRRRIEERSRQSGV